MVAPILLLTVLSMAAVMLVPRGWTLPVFALVVGDLFYAAWVLL